MEVFFEHYFSDDLWIIFLRRMEIFRHVVGTEQNKNHIMTDVKR